METLSISKKHVQRDRFDCLVFTTRVLYSSHPSPANAEPSTSLAHNRQFSWKATSSVWGSSSRSHLSLGLPSGRVSRNGSSVPGLISRVINLSDSIDEAAVEPTLALHVGGRSMANHLCPDAESTEPSCPAPTTRKSSGSLFQALLVAAMHILLLARQPWTVPVEYNIRSGYRVSSANSPSRPA